jgi:transcriptional regulator with XRE-family HTH domain
MEGFKMYKNTSGFNFSWGAEKFTRPPVNRLYDIEPVGIGTPYTESITGYVIRLAQAHHMYVSDLLAREIVPVMNKEYMVEVAEKRGNRFYEYIAKLNSMGPGVLDFIQSLEKLNFRKDLRFLTLQGWSNAFASKRLIRATRAWCPDCYNDWCSRKQTIYDPLIWGLQTVTICGRHQKRLTTACPHCNRELPLIGRLSLVGCCERCGGGLGLRSENEDQSVIENIDWENWVAHNVGQLIALTPQIVDFPEDGQILRYVDELKKHLSDGEGATLARSLGIPKTSLWEVLNGRYLPSLDMLLRICYYYSIPLIELLTTGWPDTLKISENKPPETARSPRSSKIFENDKVKRELEATIADSIKSPPSLQDVAMRLGYSKKTLSNHFPELCHLISKRYLNQRRQKAIERIDRLGNEVKEAVRELYGQGLCPSKERVEELTRPGALKEKSIREIWQDALNKLYPTSRSPHL